MSELSKKQEQFCHEFIIDLNATASYLRVSPKAANTTARTESSKLLAKPNIQRRVHELMKERTDRTKIDADTVLRELRDLALVDLAECFSEDGSLKSIHEIPKSVRKAISSIEVNELFDGIGKDRVQVGLIKKMKFWDKNKSLENLGRHLKLFTDVQELGGDLEIKKLSDDQLENMINQVTKKVRGSDN